jgi:hypothetical protein
MVARRKSTNVFARLGHDEDTGYRFLTPVPCPVAISDLESLVNENDRGSLTPPLFGTRTTETVLFVFISLVISICSFSFPRTKSTVTRDKNSISLLRWSYQRQKCKSTSELSDSSLYCRPLVLLGKLSRRVDYYSTPPEALFATLFYFSARSLSRLCQDHVRQARVATPVEVAIEKGKGVYGRGEGVGIRVGLGRWGRKNWRLASRMC